MMNFLTKLTGMNGMMAEDVNVPVLRCFRDHEMVCIETEHRNTDGLFNATFERMFAGH